jgi:hypothetical protein
LERRPEAATSGARGRHAAPERHGVEVLDAPTVRVNAAHSQQPSAPAAPRYATFDVSAGQADASPVITLPEVGAALQQAAARALPTTRSRVIAGAVAAAALLIGVAVVHSNQVSETTDSVGRPLSYSPESAVLNDCPGASASQISSPSVVEDNNDGLPIYAVPWTDDQDHTHAAWVLTAGNGSPAKYHGTYSATVCDWANVN